MATDDLPIPDFDHLPAGDITSRIRSLDDDQLRTLVDHEEAHSNRAPVLQAMRARRQQLAEGAEPSGGDAAAVDPQAPQAPAGGSQVSPTTQGPQQNPPSHGDPTNFTRGG